MRTGELIDLLRALMFPLYRNAYFEEDGTKYYVQVDITSEEEAETDSVGWDTPTLFESSVLGAVVARGD